MFTGDEKNSFTDLGHYEDMSPSLNIPGNPDFLREANTILIVLEGDWGIRVVRELEL